MGNIYSEKMIEAYSFGQMVVNGERFTSDLIITPTGIKRSWWRKSGHNLCLEDLKEALAEEAEALVIGTGFTGLMKVEEEVRLFAQSKGMSFVTKKTAEAVKSFNRLSSQKKTIGAFHLTC